nr:hypothetical protein [Tanacetum cinerariifolium]
TTLARLCPGPEHADDEIVAEDQPYAEDALPTTQSPEYVPEFDLEAHPEDGDDKDPEEDLEDPVDYLADGGDNGDDAEESSEDDEDDEDDDMDIKADEEEEEEHPAPADSVVVAPTAADQAPSAKETEPFETNESAATPPPHPAYRMTARISILAPGAPVSTDTELGEYVREFETRVRQDTNEIYMRLDDEQTERQLLVGRLNMLFRDRRAHAYTRHLMETEARMSREAWVQVTYASDLVHELLRIDHRRSTEITELRTALQGQVTALQG